MGALDNVERALKVRKNGKTERPGNVLRLMADFDGLDEFRERLDDVVTQMNVLPGEMLKRMSALEKASKREPNFGPLQGSIDSLRSHVNKLVKAVENIRIEAPETPKPTKWTGKVTKRKSGGAVSEVEFSAG